MMDDNVTVMSPEELNIRDEDMEKVGMMKVTLSVLVQITSRTNDPSRGVIAFALSDVPVSTSDATLEDYAVGALHDTLIKEEFIKFKEGTRNVSLIASDDVSKITIEEVTVKKENNNEQ